MKQLTEILRPAGQPLTVLLSGMRILEYDRAGESADPYPDQVLGEWREERREKRVSQVKSIKLQMPPANSLGGDCVIEVCWII